MPIIPTVLARRTFDQLVVFLATPGRPPARRTRLLLAGGRAQNPEWQDVSRLAIPALSVIEQMAVERAPLAADAPHSAATRAYDAL